MEQTGQYLGLVRYNSAFFAVLETKDKQLFVVDSEAAKDTLRKDFGKGPLTEDAQNRYPTYVQAYRNIIHFSTDLPLGLIGSVPHPKEKSLKHIDFLESHAGVSFDEYEENILRESIFKNSVPPEDFLAISTVNYSTSPFTPRDDGGTILPYFTVSAGGVHWIGRTAMRCFEYNKADRVHPIGFSFGFD